jgi:choline dehydrogenase-like flavoprotein
VGILVGWRGRFVKDAAWVVDNGLRVHGLKGVRVADSSVFPKIISTHLQAPVVMVAEKCANMITESWKDHWLWHLENWILILNGGLEL